MKKSIFKKINRNQIEIIYDDEIAFEIFKESRNDIKSIDEIKNTYAASVLIIPESTKPYKIWFNSNLKYDKITFRHELTHVIRRQQEKFFSINLTHGSNKYFRAFSRMMEEFIAEWISYRKYKILFFTSLTNFSYPIKEFMRYIKFDIKNDNE